MNKIKDLCSRLTINRCTILKNTTKWVGICYTAWGFFSVLVSPEDYLPAEWGFWSKLLFAAVVLLCVSFVCFIVCTFIALRTCLVEVVKSNSNHKVFVQYGDMYSSDVIEKDYSGRRNLVVAVNRCFDTIVDNNLVSDRTQHGRVMKALYASGLYTEESLNEAIQHSLAVRNVPYDDLTIAQKARGNTYRYESGAVAEIDGGNNVCYFFLGLSKFDRDFAASTSKEEYTLAIQRLIEFCYSRSQGYPVVLPLLGSDMARTGISHNDILSYLVNAFRVNRDKITNDFHIVVWKGDMDKISISNL